MIRLTAERTPAGTSYLATGQGQPVVLIHGVGLNKEMWGGQIVGLASQYRVIAYDMLDRIRANAGADYAWRGGASVPASTANASVRDLDLHDFEANILGFAGASAKGSVSVSAGEVTVSISWDDSRGANRPGARETFTLTSRISDESRGAQ